MINYTFSTMPFDEEIKMFHQQKKEKENQILSFSNLEEQKEHVVYSFIRSFYFHHLDFSKSPNIVFCLFSSWCGFWQEIEYSISHRIQQTMLPPVMTTFSEPIVIPISKRCKYCAKNCHFIENCGLYLLNHLIELVKSTANFDSISLLIIRNFNILQIEMLLKMFVDYFSQDFVHFFPINVIKDMTIINTLNELTTILYLINHHPRNAPFLINDKEKESSEIEENQKEDVSKNIPPAPPSSPNDSSSFHSLSSSFLSYSLSNDNDDNNNDDDEVKEEYFEESQDDRNFVLELSDEEEEEKVENTTSLPLQNEEKEEIHTNYESVIVYLNNYIKIDTFHEKDTEYIENIENKENEIFECPVCLNSIYKNEIMVANCYHNFCFNCICRFTTIKEECPVCREEIYNVFTTTKNLSNIILQLK